MILNREVIESIKNIVFLSQTGTIEVDYELITDLHSAEKSINSLKWENLCLEMRGKFTASLSKNNEEIFQEWNNIVKEVKEKIIPLVEEQLNNLVMEKKITENMKAQIKFDIINISLYKTYSPFISSDFYESLYGVYLKGYIPCGWKGKFPKGKIKII